MPTLGFLKKKRTKDSGNKDPNSPASPTGNSPDTPTSTGGFQESIASTSSHTLSSQSQSSASKPNDKAVGGQRPPSSGLSNQQPAPSILRNPENEPVASQAAQQNPTSINQLVNTSQNDQSSTSKMENRGNGSNYQNLVADQVHVASESANTANQTRVTKGKYSLTDFTLQRTLGTGSFGRVHLVQSNHNQRFYAIKVLKKDQVVRMKQVEHTNDERRMLQKVKHSFLVTLWGTFQDSKNLYMVMDFVEGGELFSLLRKSQVSDIGFHGYYHQFYTIFEYMDSLAEKRFPNPVAKFYAAEVTLALDYLHSHHIIYRDLKPENLLLDRHGHLKITDFGFAKEVPDITWTLCGTPDYLAPEVVASKGYNKSVDW